MLKNGVIWGNLSFGCRIDEHIWDVVDRLMCDVLKDEADGNDIVLVAVVIGPVRLYVFGGITYIIACAMYTPHGLVHVSFLAINPLGDHFLVLRFTKMLLHNFRISWSD